jgi:lactaldehyde dehydrogenase/glycolaldehyde dehydrogenase
MGSITYGDPCGSQPVEMGPLINRAALGKLQGLVSDATSKGAGLVCGGAVDTSLSGFHFQPTVISNATAAMSVMQQEVFGPLLIVNTVDTLDEAISEANNSEFGLSSSIFTGSLASARQAMRDLKAGETYINRENFEAIQGFHAGIKKSGIGGADGKHGLYEFMSTQVVYM